MKQLLFLILTGIFLVFSHSANSQDDSGSGSLLPLKKPGSVMFGKDVVIDDLSQISQKHIAICSAPEGWLYAACIADSNGHTKIIVYGSIDGGTTWTKKYFISPNTTTYCITKVEILAFGNSLATQTVLIGTIGHRAGGYLYDLAVIRLQGDPLVKDDYSPLSRILEKNGDMAFAINWGNMSSMGTPVSIGCLFSVNNYSVGRLVFTYSTNNGLSFLTDKTIAQFAGVFPKVDLSFGRSSSETSGKYFAAWEQKQDSNSTFGHIYTSHSGTKLGNAFTAPIQLDGLDSSLTNLCRNPVIACQVNNMDNDSANISQVVLFEKFNAGNGDCDITGFYNKKAATANYFTRLNIAASSHNEIHPDIVFNKYDTSFAITYYDSTTQKLPLLKNSMNLIKPDDWEVLTPGYNETFGMDAPDPIVRVNMQNDQLMNCWTGKRSNGNEVALFDAPYMPPTGILEQGLPEPILSLKVSPNPCSTSFTVSFETKMDERVSGGLFNLLGKSVMTMDNRFFMPGKHTIKCHVDDLPAGTYFCRLSAGQFSKTVKIVVIR